MLNLILQSDPTTSRLTHLPHLPALPPLPLPKVPLSIRPAAMGDLAFVDRLQRMHTKAVGWTPTIQLEGCIKQDRILVAWASRPCLDQDMGETPMLREEPIGYLMGADRYFKRDDVGIIGRRSAGIA